MTDILVSPEHEAAAIVHDIKTLNDLAKQLREQRFQDGALSISSMSLQFKLDEQGFPVDCWQDTASEAKQLVEEVLIPAFFRTLH